MGHGREAAKPQQGVRRERAKRWLWTALRVGYRAAAAALCAAALCVVGVHALNHRDYAPLALRWARGAAPGIDAAAVRAHWTRNSLSVSAEAAELPGIRVERLGVSAGWRALAAALGGRAGAFGGATARVDGANIALSEAADGRWSLSGDGARRAGAVARWIPGALSWLRRLRASDVRLTLTLASGQRWDLAVPEAQLWRDTDGRWQLFGSLRASSATKSARVRAALDVERRRARASIEGLSLPAIRLAGGWRSVALSEVGLDAQAWRLDGGDWVADVERIALGHRGQRIALRDIQLRRRRDHWQVAVPTLDLSALRELALSDPRLPEPWRGILETMRPEGSASRLRLSLPANAGAREALARARLRANIDGLRFRHWKNVPGVSGIDGSIEAGTRGGSMAFHAGAQGAELDFPAAYGEPLRVRSARGALRWRLADDRRIQLTIDPVTASADGVDSARLLGELDIPYAAGGAPTRLRFVAGWRDVDVDTARRYLPKFLSHELRGWLRETALEGAMRAGGTIYHGALGPLAAARPTQFYADFDGLRLRLDDAVPDIDNARGQLTLDGPQLLFNAREAWMAGDSWRAGGAVHGRLHIRVDESSPERTLRPRQRAYRVSGSAQNIALELPWIGDTVPHISLKIDGAPDEWNFSVRHPRIGARASVPTGDAPSLIEIRHLLFPKLAFSKAAANERPSIDGWPDLDVDIKRLRVGERDIGPVYFQMRSGPDRLSLRNVSAALGGVTLQGRDNRFGDHFTWLRREPLNHRSELAFRAETASLTSAARALGAPSELSGRHATASGSLAWNGHPLDFSLARANGALSFSIENGLLRTDRSARNPLRAIAALDLDQWVSRGLRGRFVRYNSRGILFDRLSGDVSLRNGRLFADTPVTLTNPSAELLVNGSVDLRERSVDGQLVVGLPASRNVGWFTLLAGSNPATSAAALAGGRLLDRWIDRFASVTYRISGRWDEPELRLNRVFNRGQLGARRGARRAR